MKTRNLLALLFFLVTLASTESFAAASLPHTEKGKKPLTEEQQKARLSEINNRIEEIKNTDKSSLTSQEKKAFRKELKKMKKEAKEVKGVYLSVGAIIIIVLLLIILL